MDSLQDRGVDPPSSQQDETGKLKWDCFVVFSDTIGKLFIPMMTNAPVVRQYGIGLWLPDRNTYGEKMNVKLTVDENKCRHNVKSHDSMLAVQECGSSHDGPYEEKTRDQAALNKLERWFPHDS